MAAVGDHSDTALIFKVSYGTDTRSVRRITYPKGRLCHFEGLRGTIERLFYLSASPFFIAYTDDDGDETAIKSDSDLSEAISYFQSGLDDAASSYSYNTTSTYDSTMTGGGSGGGKITLRVQVIVEFDGSLSDAASIAESAEDRESTYSGYGDEYSERGSSWASGSSQVSERVPPGTTVIIEDDWDDEPADLSRDPFLEVGPAPRSISGPHPLSQSHRPRSDLSSSPSQSSRDLRSQTPFRASSVQRSPFNSVESLSLRVPPSRRPSSSSSSGHASDEGGDDSHSSQHLRRFAKQRSPRQSQASGHDPGYSSHQSQSSYTHHLSHPDDCHYHPHDSHHRHSYSDRRHSSGQYREHCYSSDHPEYDCYDHQPPPQHRKLSSNQSPQYAPTLRPFDSLAISDEATSPSSSSQSADAISISSSASGLENSEFGARWLREQGELLARKVGPPASSGKRPQTASDRSMDDKDHEREGELGDLELERDQTGRWYYNYSASTSSSAHGAPNRFSNSTMASSLLDPFNNPSFVLHPQTSRTSSQPVASSSSQTGSTPYDADAEHDAEHYRLSLGSSSSSDLSKMFPDIPPELLTFVGDEESSTPRMAPDCSACGIRLDYMRYTCLKCGESDGKLDPSIITREGAGPSRSGAHRHHHEHPEDEEDDDGYASDGTELVGHRKSVASLATLASTTSDRSNKPLPRRPGFELCAGCIESHGQTHASEFYRSRIPGALRVKGDVGHTFVERVWSGNERTGWNVVQYEDNWTCSTCSNPITRERFKCVSCAKFDLCKGCFQKVEDIHPIHAFLSVADDRPGTATTTVPAEPVRHPGAFCHNCLQDIVGPRFHCAICPSWDLCNACERSPGSALGNGVHQADHIMMKIPLPLGAADIEEVSRRARDQWAQQDAQTVGASVPEDGTASALVLQRAVSLPVQAQSSQLRLPPFFSPPASLPPQLSPTAPQKTLTSSSAPAAPAPAPAPAPTRSGWNFNLSSNGISLRRTQSTSPSALTGSAATAGGTSAAGGGSSRTTGHNTRCSACTKYIVGPRYQCANCPSDPVAYNLCSSCEPRSYQLHDAMHVFLRFDRPVDFEVRSPRPLFPLLYSRKAGTSTDPDLAQQIGITSIGSHIEMRNLGDPNAYLKHLYHPSTVCDFCMIPITGAWHRCAICPKSFDLCAACHNAIEHDPTHAFVVFKSDVDMGPFRELTDLSVSSSRPLIAQQIYLPVP